MIRLKRPEEPEALRRERTWRIAAFLLSDEEPSTALGYNLDGVREALARCQHDKCAYCEAELGSPHFYPIEHFRPRKHYWWLTWTWENLWLSCPVCQGKGDRFGLNEEERHPRLQAPSKHKPQRAFHVWLEHPRLLDPATDDPRQHLGFAPNPRTLNWRTPSWEWTPLSERGLYTICLLKLKKHVRSGRHERMRNHIQRRLGPDCEVLRKPALLAPSVLQERWEKLGLNYLYREAPFLTLSWWYLSHVFVEAGLASHGLQMHAYPDDNPSPATTWPIVLDTRDRPDWLTGEALWYVRYFQRQDDPKSFLRDAILTLCKAAPKPLSNSELGELLNRNSSTISSVTRELVSNLLISRSGKGVRDDPYRFTPAPG